MKNKIKPAIFILLWMGFITVSITSCKEATKQVINKGEKYVTPEYPKKFTYGDIDNVEDYQDYIVLASDNHEYLIFDKGSTGEKKEHYWNCKTCKK